MLRRVRPKSWYQVAEAVAGGAFVVLGLVGLLLTGAFLANIFPRGVLGDLFSSGTVFYLNVAVGAEVTSGVVVLLSGFLAQALSVREVR
jgi:multicomponent Na+:H+ antiporter subunit B